MAGTEFSPSQTTRSKQLEGMGTAAPACCGSWLTGRLLRPSPKTARVTAATLNNGLFFAAVWSRPLAFDCTARLRC